MTLPNYDDNSQSIAVMTGFIQLMLEANKDSLIEKVLGKPLAFNDSGIYNPSEIGIYVMVSGEDGMALTVSTYIADPNVGPGITEYAVQVRARSENKDYRPAMFMLDALRDHDDGPRLNGRSHSDLAGYNATIIQSTSIGDMGLDANDRYELTENYYLIVNDEPGKVLPFPRYE